MSAHLIALTVGPVQEFIAAARRTRDLWFGSYLLSEISKASAKAVQKAVQDHGGSLIFPTPHNHADLDPDSPLNVANVIVAELTQGEPAVVTKVAREAAQARWRSFANLVLSQHQAVINVDIWNDQIGDVIEFYAAWIRYSPATYQADRATLMRLLAGRKRCRDFLPARGRAGIPKSSLDGLRESVLRPPKGWPERSRRRLRTQEGEQLDVIGMVKRTWAPASGNPRYPSVARVAADPWLRGVGHEALAPLQAACVALGGDVIHEMDTSIERGYPHYASFPFEGTAVYRSRYRDLQKEAELSDFDVASLAQALAPITQNFGEPSPYLAVLVADGDRMGETLSRLASAEKHRAFSKALATFASKVHEVVRQHHGVLVYAGGDDVLAFVPVDQCLPCARALHDNFGDILAPEAAGSRPTLSVGLVIAHFMESLENLLEYGRGAEKHAKQPRPEDGPQAERNALAVHVIKRGGGPIAVRANWSDEPDRQLQSLAEWIRARAISGRVAHDLRKIASVYDEWPAGTVRSAIQRDTLATLTGKQPAGESKMREVERFVRDRVSGADSLRRLGDELIVARQIALAMGQADNDAEARESSV